MKIAAVAVVVVVTGLLGGPALAKTKSYSSPPQIAKALSCLDSYQEDTADSTGIPAGRVGSCDRGGLSYTFVVTRNGGELKKVLAAGKTLACAFGVDSYAVVVGDRWYINPPDASRTRADRLAKIVGGKAVVERC